MAKPLGKRIGQIDDRLANVEAMILAELAKYADGAEDADITDDYEPDFKKLNDELISFGCDIGEEIARKDPKAIFKQDANTTRFLSNFKYDTHYKNVVMQPDRDLRKEM